MIRIMASLALLGNAATLLAGETAPPCTMFLPPHFPLLGWVCASVCHGGETAPPHRAPLPPDTLNFTRRPPAAAAGPPTARPCALSLAKDLFLPQPLRPQPVTRSLGRQDRECR